MLKTNTQVSEPTMYSVLQIFYVKRVHDYIKKEKEHIFLTQYLECPVRWEIGLGYAPETEPRHVLLVCEGDTHSFMVIQGKEGAEWIELPIQKYQTSFERIQIIVDSLRVNRPELQAHFSKEFI